MHRKWQTQEQQQQRKIALSHIHSHTHTHTSPKIHKTENGGNIMHKWFRRQQQQTAQKEA